MNRVTGEAAFVLHTRPYRNSSLIVELFSLHYGRIFAAARSARGPKSRYKGCLQPFFPLWVSWTGKQELLNLGQVEFQGVSYPLSGQSLPCAFYLNELLHYLLPALDPYPKVFADYQNTLAILQHYPAQLEMALRCFEKRLLEQLGYGLSWGLEASSAIAIQPDFYYQFVPDQGFSRCSSEYQNGGHSFPRNTCFLGRHLLAIGNEQFEETDILANAKRIMRICLSRLLGPHTLHSRKMLRLP